MRLRNKIIRSAAIAKVLFTPGWIVELFAASNLGFLALDVYLAHSINAFRSRAEWIPVVFSLAAPLGLLPGIFVRQRWPKLVDAIGLVIGCLSSVVGIAGLVFHLGNAFFEQQTLKSLVYTAPFAAPLAYVGIGFLIILNRMLDENSELWACWVIFLAMAGFVGNFALSLADHAQNGLFSPIEWLPVVAASYGSAFLLVALSTRSRLFLVGCLWIQLVESMVGVAGFGLHVWSNISEPVAPLRERIIYGAPLFAPLLFTDLAALAALGLVLRIRHLSAGEALEHNGAEASLERHNVA